ncbi:MAG: NADH-quinone oxidoreductase subunit K [Thalassobaculaceae bacterium]|uniref:NADH-quinone oxidoreductase subunit K n=1 Tax=Roseitalea porphyridii TaxID=1852022 RepID=UPI0032EE32CC
MEPYLAVAVGLVVAAAVYLMTDRHMVRMLFGVALLGTAVNLIVFISGDVLQSLPPLIASDAAAPEGEVANALPQALVLTAIVIGFGLFSFALALVFKTAQRFGTADVGDLGVAEPLGTSGPSPDGPSATPEATAERKNAA